MTTTAVHVCPGLGDDSQGGGHVDAVDAREVHAAHPEQRKRPSTSSTPEPRRWQRFRQLTLLQRYAEALKDAIEILIVGPGEEKTAFVTHVKAHQPLVAAKIQGAETIDHPNEGQLLAYARKHFTSAGSLHKS